MRQDDGEEVKNKGKHVFSPDIPFYKRGKQQRKERKEA